LVDFYRHFRGILVLIFRVEDFHPENEGSRFLQNIGTGLSHNIVIFWK
jgi:hypothetical protein